MPDYQWQPRLKDLHSTQAAEAWSSLPHWLAQITTRFKVVNPGALVASKTPAPLGQHPSA